MALFASPDIAVLVAAFPPPSPTKEQPTLVRSSSGNHLLDSTSILSRFRTLLKTEPSRIKRSDLPARLGIQNVSWLLECYEGPIYYSKDKQSFVPEKEMKILVEDLLSRCQTDFVELSSFAAQADITLDSLNSSSRELDSASLRWFAPTSANGEVYLAGLKLFEEKKDKIIEAVKSTGSEKVDLIELLPEVPDVILRVIVDEVKNEISGSDGHFEDLANSFVFVPSGYAVAREQKLQAAYDLKLQDLVQTLETDGFCQLPVGVDESDVTAKYKHQNSEADTPITVNIDGTIHVVALPSVFNQVLDKLKLDVAAFAIEHLSSSNISVDSAMRHSIIASSPLPKLASFIVQSEYLETIEAAFKSTITEQRHDQRREMEETFQITVMLPTHLYLLGLGTVADATLKQHLDDYLCDHFRREVLPDFANLVRKQASGSNDKALARDVEKLKSSSDQAKGISDIHTAVSKFAKKQKLEHPSTERIQEVKQQILQDKLKAIRKMTRGSDVLQNLIWILLAQKSEGLFMSSGKDTSRMLKQYQLVGDGSTAAKLAQWRDMLKTGQESADALQVMKEMAASTVDDMYGH